MLNLQHKPKSRAEARHLTQKEKPIKAGAKDAKSVCHPAKSAKG
jgi:hypothetical protein